MVALLSKSLSLAVVLLALGDGVDTVAAAAAKSKDKKDKLRRRINWTDVEPEKMGKSMMMMMKKVDFSRKPPPGENYCQYQGTLIGTTKPKFGNLNCTDAASTLQGIGEAVEQAGSNVTVGYQGDLDTDAVPITRPFYTQGMCAVNVHFHLGAEHFSVGQYDQPGGTSGPGIPKKLNPDQGGSDQGAVRNLGYQCGVYDKKDKKFKKKYKWEHCENTMQVGQTYEVHWPHSAAGACGSINQYQEPFYDGVFCLFDIPAFAAGGNPWPPPYTADRAPWEGIGVQAQVFIIVNDEDYYFPNLIDGMIVDRYPDDGDPKGVEITAYTGSTTGTSRDNEICSPYAPITWHVDRRCHLISASSFDKLCLDMKSQREDFTPDQHAAFSRTLVNDTYASNNRVDCDTCGIMPILQNPDP